MDSRGLNLGHLCKAGPVMSSCCKTASTLSYAEIRCATAGSFATLGGTTTADAGLSHRHSARPRINFDHRDPDLQPSPINIDWAIEVAFSPFAHPASATPRPARHTCAGSHTKVDSSVFSQSSQFANAGSAAAGRFSWCLSVNTAKGSQPLKDLKRLLMSA